MLAFVPRVQLTDQQVKSYHTKRYFEKLHAVHKGMALSEQKLNNRNKMCWTSMFSYLNHHQNWAAMLTTSVIAISLKLWWRLTRKRREMVGLHHYHNHYHYHPHSNPLMIQPSGGDHSSVKLSWGTTKPLSRHSIYTKKCGVCRHLCMCGMKTFRNVWNASVLQTQFWLQKEMLSAVYKVTAEYSASVKKTKKKSKIHIINQ